ncbi:MAG: JAB domain-containing protein [Sphingobium sp.]|nr:JAB domain-containing protein [Sphingobium sp.]
MPHRAPRLDIWLLDTDWRPIGRVEGDAPWRMVVAHSIRLQSRWLRLEQARDRRDPPRPLPADIALTRTLRRRLRPLGIDLADHLIRHGDATFSFRANRLL